MPVRVETDLTNHRVRSALKKAVKRSVTTSIVVAAASYAYVKFAENHKVSVSVNAEDTA